MYRSAIGRFPQDVTKRLNFIGLSCCTFRRTFSSSQELVFEKDSFPKKKWLSINSLLSYFLHLSRVYSLRPVVSPRDRERVLSHSLNCCFKTHASTGPFSLNRQSVRTLAQSRCPVNNEVRYSAKKCDS